MLGGPIQASVDLLAELRDRRRRPVRPDQLVRRDVPDRARALPVPGLVPRGRGVGRGRRGEAGARRLRGAGRALRRGTRGDGVHRRPAGQRRGGANPSGSGRSGSRAPRPCAPSSSGSSCSSRAWVARRSTDGAPVAGWQPIVEDPALRGPPPARRRPPPPGDRGLLVRGAGLAPGGRLGPVERHPQRPGAALASRRRRASVFLEPSEFENGHTLRPRRLDPSPARTAIGGSSGWAATGP